MRPSRPTMARIGRFSSRHHVTSVVSPNVQIMAMPVPLSGCASSWATIGTSTPYRGVRTVVPKCGLVPLVVGVRDERDARGEQLGASGVDLDDTVAVGSCERDLVVGARTVAVLHLGLGDGGPEVDVPQGGCFLAVRLAAGDVAEERALAGAPRPFVDGGVLMVPVDRQAEPPEADLRRSARRVRPVRRTTRGSWGARSARRGGSSAGHRGTAVRSPRRSAGSDRIGRRSSSAPDARWAGRCRPSPSGRRRPCPTSAGSGRSMSVWV